MITAQTINNIEKYLQYECNLRFERLSREQKLSVREKMINVRDWLGKIHPN